MTAFPLFFLSPLGLCSHCCQTKCPNISFPIWNSPAKDVPIDLNTKWTFSPQPTGGPELGSNIWGLTFLQFSRVYPLLQASWAHYEPKPSHDPSDPHLHTFALLFFFSKCYSLKISLFTSLHPSNHSPTQYLLIHFWVSYTVLSTGTITRKNQAWPLLFRISHSSTRIHCMKHYRREL